MTVGAAAAAGGANALRFAGLRNFLPAIGKRVASWFGRSAPAATKSVASPKTVETVFKNGRKYTIPINPPSVTPTAPVVTPNVAATAAKGYWQSPGKYIGDVFNPLYMPRFAFNVLKTPVGRSIAGGSAALYGIDYGLNSENWADEAALNPNANTGKYEPGFVPELLGKIGLDERFTQESLDRRLGGTGIGNPGILDRTQSGDVDVIKRRPNESTASWNKRVDREKVLNEEERVLGIERKLRDEDHRRNSSVALAQLQNQMDIAGLNQTTALRGIDLQEKRYERESREDTLKGVLALLALMKAD